MVFGEGREREGRGMVLEGRREMVFGEGRDMVSGEGREMVLEGGREVVLGEGCGEPVEGEEALLVALREASLRVPDTPSDGGSASGSGSCVRKRRCRLRLSSRQKMMQRMIISPQVATGPSSTQHRVTTPPLPDPGVATPHPPRPGVTTPPLLGPGVTTPHSPRPGVTTPPLLGPGVTTPHSPRPGVTTPPLPRPGVTTPPLPDVLCSGSHTHCLFSNSSSSQGLTLSSQDLENLRERMERRQREFENEVVVIPESIPDHTPSSPSTDHAHMYVINHTPSLQDSSPANEQESNSTSPSRQREAPPSATSEPPIDDQEKPLSSDSTPSTSPALLFLQRGGVAVRTHLGVGCVGVADEELWTGWCEGEGGVGERDGRGGDGKQSSPEESFFLSSSSSQRNKTRNDETCDTCPPYDGSVHMRHETEGG